MHLPMTYISLTDGTTTYKIATSVLHPVSGTRANMIFTECQGLFTPGENQAEARERTYSHGSVLPSKARFAGKDFTIDIGIYSENKPNVDVKGIYQAFMEFCQADRLTFTSDFPHTLTVQMQDFRLERADWRGGRLIVRVFFKAEEH